MNLVRKIKISKITNTSLTGIDKEIIDFIDSILDDLTPFKMYDEISSMYYMNSKGEWILEQDNIHDLLRVRHNGFWEVLRNTFFMEYKDIQTLLHYMIEQAFKKKISYLPHLALSYQNRGVEDAFKQKVFKPHSTPSINDSSKKAEEAFKRKKPFLLSVLSWLKKFLKYIK